MSNDKNILNINDNYILYNEILDLFNKNSNNIEFNELLDQHNIRNKLFIIEKGSMYLNKEECNFSFTLYGRIPKEYNLSVELLEIEDKIAELIENNYSKLSIYKSNIPKLPASILKSILESIYNIKEGVSINCTIPEKLILHDLNKNEINLDVKDNELIIIDFWATWCKYCQPYINHLADLSKKLKNFNNDNSLKFIAISANEKIDDVINHIDINKDLNYLNHYVKTKIREDFNITLIPNLGIIDKTKKFVYFGHPKYINIENAINNIMNDKDIYYLDNDNYKHHEKTDFSSEIELLYKNFINKEELSVNILIEFHRMYSFESKKYFFNINKGVLFGEVLEYEEELCLKNKDKIISILNLDPNNYIKYGCDSLKFNLKTSSLCNEDF